MFIKVISQFNVIDTVIIITSTGIQGEIYGMHPATFESKYDFVKGNTFKTKAFNPIKVLQYTGNNIEEVMQFCPYAVIDNEGVLYVQASWGNLEAKVGDFITRYSSHDFGVVDYNVFCQTYEKA